MTLTRACPTIPAWTAAALLLTSLVGALEGQLRTRVFVRTAKALDLTIPPTLLARADQVIE